MTHKFVPNSSASGFYSCSEQEREFRFFFAETVSQQNHKQNQGQHVKHAPSIHHNARAVSNKSAATKSLKGNLT